jgi:hypothetical protein
MLLETVTRVQTKEEIYLYFEKRMKSPSEIDTSIKLKSYSIGYILCMEENQRMYDYRAQGKVVGKKFISKPFKIHLDLPEGWSEDAGDGLAGYKVRLLLKHEETNSALQFRILIPHSLLKLFTGFAPAAFKP